MGLSSRVIGIWASLMALLLCSACGGGNSSVNGSGTPSAPPPPVAQGFTATSSMHTARARHAAVLLKDGRVLVTGGMGVARNALASSEAYDLHNLSFTATGNMVTARSGHTATVLLDGKVLIAGGDDGTGQALSSAELFDPGTGTFAATGSLNSGRIGHTATLLKDGRVLIAGGGTASAELFDPATQNFVSAPSMSTNRTFHAAVLLSDGRVLLVGGTDSNGSALGDIFDPATSSFTATATGGTVDFNLAGLLLNNGTVLLVGGEFTALLSGGSTRCCLTGPKSVKNANLFDPAGTGNFSFLTGMAASRASHTITLLADGSVLIAGGASIDSIAVGTTVNTTVTPLATAEIFDPAAGSFAMTTDMTTARTQHTATRLSTGDVLITGGINGSGTVLATAESYHP